MLALPFLSVACAGSPDSAAPRLAGESGPVAWEVTNVGRVERADGMRMRWSFTIVLREQAGSAIQFERIEASAHGPNIETGAISRIPCARRLHARSELQHNTGETWGFVSIAGRQFGGVSSLGSVTIERRYVGKDAQGRLVAVPVRVVLHPGFGRKSRQPSTPDRPTPPAKLLQAGELPSLKGTWEGYYTSNDFLVPITAVIGDGGSIDVAENDPVTNRFRGSLSLREGRIVYAGRETGEFVLHQDASRRMLVGHIAQAPLGSAPAVTLPVRLEAIL
jgi:hypothetical protein